MELGFYQSAKRKANIFVVFGGALANPVQNYPQVFGKSALLKNFPYALPNIVASVFFIVGLAAGWLFLKVPGEMVNIDRC